MTYGYPIITIIPAARGVCFVIAGNIPSNEMVFNFNATVGRCGQYGRRLEHEACQSSISVETHGTCLVEREGRWGV